MEIYYSGGLVNHSFFIKNKGKENQKKYINRHSHPPEYFSLC